FPFPIALQTARLLDTDSLLIWQQFASVYPIRQTQQYSLVGTSQTTVAENSSRFALASPFPVASCNKAIRVESRVCCGQCFSETMTEGIEADSITYNRCAIDWLEMDVSCKRWQ